MPNAFHGDTWQRGQRLFAARPQRHALAGSRFDLVVMAASVGGVKAFEAVLSRLPEDFPLPIAVVQHRSTSDPNLMARVFSRHTPLVVKTAEEGERMQAGTVYLAPPQLHLLVDSDLRVGLSDGIRIRHVRSSANPLFE